MDIIDDLQLHKDEGNLKLIKKRLPIAFFLLIISYWLHINSSLYIWLQAIGFFGASPEIGFHSMQTVPQSIFYYAILVLKIIVSLYPFYKSNQQFLKKQKRGWLKLTGWTVLFSFLAMLVTFYMIRKNTLIYTQKWEALRFVYLFYLSLLAILLGGLAGIGWGWCFKKGYNEKGMIFVGVGIVFLLSLSPFFAAILIDWLLR